MSEDRKREEEEAGSASSASSASSVPERAPVAAAGSEEEKLDAPEDSGVDDVDLREMMRSVMDRPPQGAPPNILGGVQRKLRTRSRGKFYGDGWSTARTPRSTYLVTSLFMLALIAFVFLVLIPWGGGALP